ncbi:hypothetical protein KL925_000004 [Ogataea polymorpha]|nr:hypothetical protein KL925_000004 [Ogataea polymorpha]
MSCTCCTQPPKSANSSEKDPFYVHTSTVFDSLSCQFLTDVSFKVDPTTGLITQVLHSGSDLQVSSTDIDLRGKIVMPGFVDAHTHIFLHSYDEADNAKQKRDESFVERVIRATNHCRTALMAGYTTYRDLGSEGMQEADANFRDAINRGIAVGPRLFVATKVLASVAGIKTHTENTIGGTRMPVTSEECDGEDEIRKAVRRRIGLGCDVVKFFADYRKRIMRYPPAIPHPYVSSVMFPPENPNPDVVLYTQKEMNVICEEARNADCPVAAHCATNRGAVMAARAGANTIEHAFWCNTDTLAVLKENHCILVPTLTIAERLYGPKFPGLLAKTHEAWKMGLIQACGGDTGTFNHGENVREAELFLEAGIPLEDTLRSLTYHGWLASGGDQCGRKFGWLAEGTAADMVAFDEDPRQNPKALRHVSFVMKDGRVYKKDGKQIFN